MRVMVVVKASKESESGAAPDPKIFEEMGKFNQELVKAGIMVSGDGLRATRRSSGSSAAPTRTIPRATSKSVPCTSSRTSAPS
jgi:hypothetical protein